MVGKVIKSIDGLPVIDAVKPPRVNVTNGDIKKASVKDPGNCAFARACKRDLHIQEARVHLSRVYIKTFGSKHWTRYLTPPDLRGEIIAFDRGGHFLEGEFVLNKPHHSKRLGNDKRKRPNTNRKKRSRPGKPRGYTQIRDVRGGPA